MAEPISLIDLRAEYESISKELIEAAIKVLQSGNYIMGQEVSLFEKEVAKYCGAKHAVAVASGTDALILTLDAYGIGQNDEVITTPFTFFATAEAISRVGAKPIFVDIDPVTYNIDPSKIESALTTRVKAIIPVHLFGQPANINHIHDIATRYNLTVIEDAAQSFGAEYAGSKIGGLSDATIFSFFPTKNLGGYGDGGMIVTNSDEICNKLKSLRLHGSNPKYYHSLIGYNSRLDEIQAAMLRVKLRYIDGWNAKRVLKAELYNRLLADLPLKLPRYSNNLKHVYHLYIIETANKKERQSLKEYLARHGIAAGIYYPVPLHLQEVYKYLGYSVGSLPNAESASDRLLALPLYPELDDKEIGYICSVLHSMYLLRK